MNELIATIETEYLEESGSGGKAKGNIPAESGRERGRGARDAGGICSNTNRVKSMHSERDRKCRRDPHGSD